MSAFRTLSAALTCLSVGLSLVVSEARAESPYQAPPPAAAKAEKAPPAPGKPKTDKAEPGKPEAGKPKTDKPKTTSSEAAKGKTEGVSPGAAKERATAVPPALPAPKALPPDIAGECAWTGKRVISLLARDDVEQAGRFLSFYRDFKCRDSHLGPTFRCVIMGSDAPEGADSAEETFTSRVDRCWSRG